MPSAPRTHPPQPTTLNDPRTFLAHLLQDTGQPLEDQITALQELLLFVQNAAYRDGLSAQRRSDSQGAANQPTAVPSLETLWAELLRTGTGLPCGLSKLSGLVAKLGEVRALAMFVSIVERNALEEFHDKHLSDAQMRELNPIVRNSVFTALHAVLTMDRSDYARGYVDYHSQHIPPYWEQPELLDGYRQSLKRSGEDVEANRRPLTTPTTAVR